MSSGKPGRFPDPPCPLCGPGVRRDWVGGRGHTQGLVHMETRGAPAALSLLDPRLGRLAGCWGARQMEGLVQWPVEGLPLTLATQFIHGPLRTFSLGERCRGFSLGLLASHCSTLSSGRLGHEGGQTAVWCV